MRLFIAILFDDVAVEAISSIRDRLHDEASSGAFVPRENLHLTLEFLGECTAAERYDAAAAIDSVPFQPFPINLDHLGRFQRPDGDLLFSVICIRSFFPAVSILRRDGSGRISRWRVGLSFLCFHQVS